MSQCSAKSFIGRGGSPAVPRRRLLHEWVPGRGLTPTAVAEKVKRFFFFYSANRHKVRRALSAAMT